MDINKANRSFVDSMIKHKNESNPYMSGGPSVFTDTDVFPYTRYFRGEYKADNAIIYEREAGWHPVVNNAYQVPLVKEEVKLYPNHCFQTAPSTTFPCYPEYQRKYADKDAMAIQLFRSGTNQYR
jgi:hypothetical protein